MDSQFDPEFLLKMQEKEKKFLKALRKLEGALPGWCENNGYDDPVELVDPGPPRDIYFVQFVMN